MKLISQISRVLIGCLFIFSGFIKSNDPTGFSYKLNEYFSVFASDLKVEQDSIYIYVNDSLCLSRQINADQPELVLTAQNKSWELTLQADSNHIDTIPTSEFALFIENKMVFKEPISTQKKYKYEIKGNSSLFKGTYQVEKGEIKQLEEKINLQKSIKKESYWVGFFEGLKKYALILAIFICVIEILLGFALLIGWNPTLIAWLLLGMTLFFTFLTWYSATYNKVTDCGCFGDAIPLTPYQSFYKDLILLVLIVFVLIGKRHLKPLFSNIFSINFLAFITILATSFALYCHYYLPFINFLAYKPGNDIKALMQTPPHERLKDHVIITYVYKNDKGEEQKIVFDSDKNTFTPAIDYAVWHFDRIESEKVIATAYKPPVHDFRIQDAERNKDYVSDFFNNSPVKLLVVFQDVNKANKASLKKLSKIATEWKEKGYELWALTASSAEDAERFRHENQLPFDFYYGDDTNLKSIIRSNPGLLLITDSSVVKETWPSTLLPKTKAIEKLVKKGKK